MATAIRPQPQEWPQLKAENSWKIRHLDCYYYDFCLVKAGSHFWRNFSCKFCPYWIDPVIEEERER